MEQEAPREFEVGIETAIAAPEAFGSSFDEAPHVEALDLGEGLEGDPAIAFRRTLGMFATGVTIVTARHGEQVHGMTANAFMSVSLQPPLVLVSVDRRARLSNLLHEGTRFGVNVLEARQEALSDHFAGRDVEASVQPRFELAHDTPLVEGALAHLVARVVRSYWGGDHSLFLGQVLYARYGEGEPLLFHGGRYERLIRDPRVFSALPQELLEPILALGQEREYEDGATIMRRGEPGSELMLIVEGAVRVERPGRTLTLGAGDLVGEIEVLDPVGSRIADTHAVGRVRCIVVTREALISALVADPRAAVGLVEVLASRFRETA